ncbi:MAG TPA: hypothetical protein VFO77_16570, partial [Actinoplanes sp.]|nr:hypothetical protein [Actinoplanes sp.]
MTRHHHVRKRVPVRRLTAPILAHPRVAALLALTVVAGGLAVAAQTDSAPPVFVAAAAGPVSAGRPAVLAAAPPTAAGVTPVARKQAEPRDDEGATKSLTDQLEAASRGYLEAKDDLAASKKTQAALAVRLKQLDAELIV